MKSSVLLAIGVGATAVIVLSVISAKQKKKEKKETCLFPDCINVKKAVHFDQKEQLSC